ncbi:MAG TPA: hypothetical protein VLI54_06705 [Bacillota bacterium]|nr:hypothetical protein [Bacillota bacterium]
MEASLEQLDFVHTPTVVHELCLIDLERAFHEAQTAELRGDMLTPQDFAVALALTEACAARGDDPFLLDELRTFWFTKEDQSTTRGSFMAATWALSMRGDEVAFGHMEARLERVKQSQQVEFAGGSSYMIESVEQSQELNALVMLCARDGVDATPWVEKFATTPEQATLAMLLYYQTNLVTAETPEAEAEALDRLETTVCTALFADHLLPSFAEDVAYVALTIATDPDTRDLAARAFLEAQNADSGRAEDQLLNTLDVGVLLAADPQLAAYVEPLDNYINAYAARVLDDGGRAHKVCRARLKWDSLRDAARGLPSSEVIAWLEARMAVMSSAALASEASADTSTGAEGTPIKESEEQEAPIVLKDNVLIALTAAAAAAGRVEDVFDYVNNMTYEESDLQAFQAAIAAADPETVAAIQEKVASSPERVAITVREEFALKSAEDGGDSAALIEVLNEVIGRIHRLIAQAGEGNEYEQEDDTQVESWDIERWEDRALRALRGIEKAAPDEYLPRVEAYLLAMRAGGSVHDTIEWSEELLSGGYAHEVSNAHQHLAEESPEDRLRSAVALTQTLNDYLYPLS